jgi:hypothetical protein
MVPDEAVSRRALLKTGLGIGVTMLVNGCSTPDSSPAPAHAEASGAAPAESGASTEAPSTKPEHDLASSSDEQLQLLGKREKALGHDFSELMVFLPMPTDEASAAERASETAGKLKEFASRGVKPYLVIEPNDPEGNPLDLKHLPTSAFGNFLDGLKKEGITGEQMGTVVVCPEPNEPIWKDGVVDADMYKKNVNALNNKVKKTFPEAKTGILLNSTSYDQDWNGDKSAGALLKYVDGLHDIDEVCLQGFPWSNDTLEPTEFLNANVALALGARLGGPSKVGIRFNTGSYATQINPDTHKTAKMNIKQRTDALVGIMKQAVAVKGQGYDTTLQIFGENKAQKEADWSYDQSAEATNLLKQFVQAADKNDIHATIYG